MYKNNPYFNKKELKTKNAEFLDNISLYQLGQVQEQEILKKEKQ
jgi:hypothetical protein